MFTNGTLNQVYDHYVSVVRGRGPGRDIPLMRDALYTDALQNGDFFPAGRCGHMNSAGRFVLGPDAAKTAVPYHFWYGNRDPATGLSGTNTSSGKVHWVSATNKKVSALVGLQGVAELQTTEFDATKTYTPNDYLTADADGKLTNDVGAAVKPRCGIDWVVGICTWGTKGRQGVDVEPTSPVSVNAYGVSMLTFYTFFFPKQATLPTA